MPTVHVSLILIQRIIIGSLRRLYYYIFSTAQAHSSVERAGLLGGVQMRSVPSDENHQLRGETLEKCIRKDLDKGLIPFYVSE